MSIDYKHVRQQLQQIVHDYKDSEGYERGQSQNFWTQVFNAYGVSGQTQTKAFEHRLKDKSNQKYVDAFIPKLVIIEQKSRGVDLNKAYTQVSEYYDRINAKDKPRYIILCNFDEIWLYDINNPLDIKKHQCPLSDLPNNAEWFEFLSPESQQSNEIIEENPINRQATEKLAKLHQAFIEDGVDPDELALFLTRLIFCFFADDTAIFGKKHVLHNLLKNHAATDGSNLQQILTTLFDTLNTEHRSSRLPEHYAQFAYINGGLFEETINIPYFDEKLYNLVMECDALDWTEISPAIFGSMFQSVLDASGGDSTEDKRREFGAHYTSEKNILKVINSLFLQELRDEFSKCTNNTPRAVQLYEKLPTLKFFDPACGCGNFLIIAYRELRLLENQLIAKIFGDQKGLLDISSMCNVTVDQFYGIEIEPHAVHIARVAMWITDHQLNMTTAERFGTTRPTTPIVYSPHIIEGNALQIDWETVLPANDCSYVMGNPPFIGKSNQSSEQKSDIKLVASHIKNHKSLDYVAGWYIKSMHYMQSVNNANHYIDTAFVSTNSIVQGEQVDILWRYLIDDCKGHINFAHHTFKWSNEGKGIAAVHCIIVGFSLVEKKEKTIFEYSDISSEPSPKKARTINAYLTDAPIVFFSRRSKQVSNESSMVSGNKATDGGNLILSDSEYIDLINSEPLAKKYIKRFMMGYEFLNNIKRWCLWFDNVDPIQLSKDLEKMPLIKKRIHNVKELRLNSTKKSTVKKAETPHLFDERRHTNKPYVAIPVVSSENRRFIPIGFIDGNTVAGNKLFVIVDGNTYQFGTLSSSMHNAFMRLTAGRMKSDYSYSSTIVYNNFPYPFMADDHSDKAQKARESIAKASQQVLDARKHYQDGSENAPTLAQLYNTYLIDPYPLLTKAHKALDKAVDSAYGYRGKGDDASRVEFLIKKIAELKN
uniref:site-specific DNA-methyltransferase (adenine-specific) n=1 Tax=Psychrobacter sp. (strain PRwf-1) TaxID=349106 RepID=A5WI42_PSYWF